MHRLAVLSFGALLLGCTPQTPPARPATPPRLDRASREEPQREEFRYLALGDSYTAGSGLVRADAFPTRLSELLQRRGRMVLLRNEGVATYTVRDITMMSVSGLSLFRPHLLTLTAGRNDLLQGRTPEDFRADLRALFGRLQAEQVSPRTVLVLSQPFWTQTPFARRIDAGVSPSTIETFNTILREETARFGGRYIDLTELTMPYFDAGMLARDGLHFGPQAYDVWAAAIARIVE